jgi:hypothetical protein
LFLFLFWVFGGGESLTCSELRRECANTSDAKGRVSGQGGNQRKAPRWRSDESRSLRSLSLSFDRPTAPPRASGFVLRFTPRAPWISQSKCTHWRQCDVRRRLRRSEGPPEARRPRRGRAVARWQRQRQAAAGVLPRPPARARASCLLLRARRRSLPRKRVAGTRSHAPRERRRNDAWERSGGAARRRRCTTTKTKTPSPKRMSPGE